MFEYSLLTWAGTGKEVTFTDAGDIVNFVAHGARDGNAIWFTTDGTLPTGLSDSIKYYLGAGADADTFLIYPTETDAINGTNQVTFSGTGSGIHKVVGDYWKTLGVADRARYGTAGSERVYSTMYDWQAYVYSFLDYTKDDCLEVEGKWTDTYYPSKIGGSMTGRHSIKITTKLNGVYGSGFHAGKIGGGYVRNLNIAYTLGWAALDVSAQANAEIDGLEIIASAMYIAGIKAGLNSFIKNCIVTSSWYTGIDCSKAVTLIGNFVYGCKTVSPAAYGIFFKQFAEGFNMFNNTVVDCYRGIFCGDMMSTNIIGNVSYGNGDNWYGVGPYSGFLNMNAGESGDVIPTSPEKSNIIITSADFKDATLPMASNSDFSPSGDSVAHTSSSGLVDVSDKFIEEMTIENDISGMKVPSYKNGSPTNLDVGAYEFDWGYGEAPISVDINIKGLVSGSRVYIKKLEDSSEIMNELESGGAASLVFPYYSDVDIEVVVRLAGYKEWKSLGTITEQGLRLTAGQSVDNTY